MPHASLRLKPGIDVNETPALNEAGISQSNLIRFIFDRNGIGLVQKLGGWTKYYGTQLNAKVRALWAWEDTNANKWLAAGTESDGSGQAELAILNGTLGSNGITTATLLNNITPRTSSDNVAVDFTTVSGSPIVTIKDATTVGITSYDSVYITTQVSVGGLILYGLYPTITLGSNTYQIVARDVLNNTLNATSSVTDGGIVSYFTSVSGSSVVNVNLPLHGLSVGSTFPIIVSTTVGGITLYGNFVVQSVVDANNFTINGLQSATSSTSVYQNSGNVRFVYSFGVGPAIASTGYGIGGYGIGGYGTGSPIVATIGTPINSSDWSFDNWGQILIANPHNSTINSISFNPIYQWDPTSNAPTATVIPQAPPINEGVFVAMPQRQIIAWGSTFTGVQDPLLVRWCDVNNFGTWAAQITNQAGSFRIPKGSRIVGAIQGPQQGLVWTDLALWSMQYVGQPYVYSFNEIGTGCGLIAKKAAASMSGTVFWMGQSQFFSLSSTGVTPIPCPIWDVIFQTLDQSNLDKIRVAPNSRFGEISWYYPSISNGGEITNYVKYNINLQQWDYGVLARTAWINESVLGPPIGADPNLYIYQHETSPDADGQPMLSSFTTGYFALSEADVKSFVDQWWPDMKWGYYGGTQNATVNLTFNVCDFAGQTPKTYGPYPLTQATTYVTPRFRGRLISMTFNSSDIGSFWRVGNNRYRYQPDGKF